MPRQAIIGLLLIAMFLGVGGLGISPAAADCPNTLVYCFKNGEKVGPVVVGACFSFNDTACVPCAYKDTRSMCGYKRDCAVLYKENCQNRSCSVEWFGNVDMVEIGERCE